VPGSLQPLTVKVPGYDPPKNRVNVEMKTERRLPAIKWILDADAIAR
jgi:hypothetical protein